MIVKELFAKLGLDVDEGAFSAAEAAMGALKGGLIAVGAALGGMAVGFAAMVRSTSNAGDNLDELAARTGVNTTALQRLGYAASFSSIGFDELAIAMNYMAKKGSKDVEKDLGKIADRVKQLTDQGRGAEAAAYAIEHLGKQGGRMVPFLREGSAAIKKMGDEAVTLGYVMDETAIKAGAEFNDSIDRLGHAWTGLRNDVIAPLLPMLTRVATRMLDWFKANRELIKQKITQALHAFVVVAKTVWTVLSAIGKTLMFVIDHWKIFASVVGGIALAALIANAGAAASAVAWFIALKVAAIAAGIQAALAWAAAAAPVVLIGILIAALILGIQDFYTFLKGGDSLIGDLFKRWKKFVFTLTAPNAQDSWIVRQLKLGIELFETLTLLARHFLFPNVSKKNKDGSEEGVIDRVQKFGMRMVLSQGGMDVDSIDRLVDGVATRQRAAPAVSAPKLYSSQPANASYQPNMSIGSVNVHVQNGDPHAVKAAVMDGIKQARQAELSATMAAVDQ